MLTDQQIKRMNDRFKRRTIRLRILQVCKEYIGERAYARMWR